MELLEGGNAYFAKLKEDLSKAKSSIFIEVYIFALDIIGKQVLELLEAAAKRGVYVSLVVDALGSPEFTPELCEELREKNIQAVIFRPIRFIHWFNFFLRRLHRKVVSIDDEIAFVGGMNIADDYCDLHHENAKWDYAVRVTEKFAKEVADHLRYRISVPANAERTYIVRDNLFYRREIENTYRRQIRSAKKEIMIACAYFFPSQGFLRDLKRAVRRGVEVHLILEGKSEVALLNDAERSLARRLFRKGMHIHFYMTRFLHSKVAVIDSNWLTVGSSNLEPWSLLTNLEANIAVNDSQLAEELRNSLLKIIREDCETIQNLEPRPLLQRMKGRIALFLLRLFNRLLK